MGQNRNIFLITALIAVCFLVTACGREKVLDGKAGSKPPVVVTTLFPQYDFARAIAGGRVQVLLLLPPGMEPHHFEPRPEDVARINGASLFIYTGSEMEPWVPKLIAGAEKNRFKVMDLSLGVTLLPVGDAAKGGHRRVQGQYDPHIWLDFGNAAMMVERIAEGIAAVDPAGAMQYRQRAELLKTELNNMDKRYREGLASCRSNVLLHGGHSAFGYLAKRYSLQYLATAGVDGSSEPAPRELARIVREARVAGVKAVFSEETVSPRVASVISREAGAVMLKLNAAHNLSHEDIARGVTFISLMDENLKNIRLGLECGN